MLNAVYAPGWDAQGKAPTPNSQVYWMFDYRQSTSAELAADGRLKPNVDGESAKEAAKIAAEKAAADAAERERLLKEEAERKAAEQTKPAPGVTAFELANWANKITARAGGEVQLPTIKATFDGKPANHTPVRVTLQEAHGAAFQAGTGQETDITVFTNDDGTLPMPKLTAGTGDFTIHLSAPNGYSGQANLPVPVTVK